MESLEAAAIEASLSSDWKSAWKLNKKILHGHPDDVGALNRLAFACLKLGKVEEAKRGLRAVLKFDPGNSIALKNLEMIKDGTLSGLTVDNNGVRKRLGVNLFLEEPGKTTTTILIRQAPWAVMASLQSGEELAFVVKKRLVEILRHDYTYVGCLPDDLSARLVSLIRAGNGYRILVKSISRKSTAVFIRETFCCAKLTGIASFPEVRRGEFYSQLVF